MSFCTFYNVHLLNGAQLHYRGSAMIHMQRPDQVNVLHMNRLNANCGGF